MIKTRVSMEEVKYLKSRLAEINCIPLENIEWVSFGKTQEFPEEIINDFKFTGLNNVDFVLTEFWSSIKING